MVRPGAPAETRTANNASVETEESARIAREQVKIAEIQRLPRNRLHTLQSGVPGAQYAMDDRGNLFASRNPSTYPREYYYLNVQNGYKWEHHTS